jgi:hypothetical protein
VYYLDGGRRYGHTRVELRVITQLPSPLPYADRIVTSSCYSYATVPCCHVACCRSNMSRQPHVSPKPEANTHRPSAIKSLGFLGFPLRTTERRHKSPVSHSHILERVHSTRPLLWLRICPESHPPEYTSSMPTRSRLPTARQNGQNGTPSAHGNSSG